MTAPGVTFLDHTADVGFDAVAPSAERLFHVAALGMLALLRGEEDAGGAAPAAHPDARVHPLALTAPDPARLLADWLRELLFLHELERLDYRRAEFETLELELQSTGDGAPDPPCRLAAGVHLSTGGHAVREIKGVTYHEIAARPVADGWTARVIFDV